MTDSLLDRARSFDDQRAGVPGEHWAAVAAGLWLVTRRPDSPLLRAAAIAGGVALVARGVTGRDGLLSWLERTLAPVDDAVDDPELADQDAFAVAPEVAPETIDIDDDNAVHDWAKRFDTTASQIRDAVAAVGDQPGDVEMHLKGSRSTSNEERVHDAI